MFAIACHDGKILCVDGASVIRKPISDISKIEELVVAVQAHGHWVLQDQYENTLDLESMSFTRAVITDSLIVDRHHNGGVVTIRRDDRYLRANNNDQIDMLAVTHGLWETFRFFEVDLIRDVMQLMRNQWVRKSTGKIADIDFSGFENEFLMLDGCRVDIHENFPFINYEKDPLKEKGSAPNSIIMHLDGWKPEEFLLYNPVVMYAFFGKGMISDQFRVSVESLFEIGKFQGTVIIVTNNSDEYVYGIINKNHHKNIKIFYMNAIDQQDYVDCRISIFNKKFIYEYQPFLYIDLDVVIDLPIKNFLTKLVISDKCSAQVEDERWVTQTPSCGATLYADDSFPIEDDAGFNGGVIGIPNFQRFGRYLRAADVMMRKYMHIHGRKSIPYDDQSILNFIFRKFDIFSGDLITPSTSVPAAEKIDFSKNDALGFAHFWPCIYREDRSLRMKSYLSILRADDKPDVLI